MKCNHTVLLQVCFNSNHFFCKSKVKENLKICTKCIFFPNKSTFWYIQGWFFFLRKDKVLSQTVKNSVRDVLQPVPKKMCRCLLLLWTNYFCHTWCMNVNIHSSIRGQCKKLRAASCPSDLQTGPRDRDRDDTLHLEARIWILPSHLYKYLCCMQMLPIITFKL